MRLKIKPIEVTNLGIIAKVDKDLVIGMKQIMHEKCYKQCHDALR